MKEHQVKENLMLEVTSGFHLEQYLQGRSSKLLFLSGFSSHVLNINKDGEPTVSLGNHLPNVFHHVKVGWFQSQYKIPASGKLYG